MTENISNSEMVTNHFPATMQDNYVPECPICGMEGGEDSLGIVEYTCGHYCGVFNADVHDDDYLNSIIQGATHCVIINHAYGGQSESFFKAATAEVDAVMTVTEAASRYGISREAVEKAIRANRLPARQSGATWLFRREDAAGLWAITEEINKANYKWWPGETEGDNYTEVRDSDGNVLTFAYNNEIEREVCTVDNPDVVSFLDEMGYDGSGDWKLA